MKHALTLMQYRLYATPCVIGIDQGLAADPEEVDPDPTFKKKTDPDPTVKKILDPDTTREKLTGTATLPYRRKVYICVL